MWKYLYDSVVGTSHLGVGGECQDSSLVTRCHVEGGETVLILVCADGAGSASQSKAGSSLACATAASCAAKFFEEGGNAQSLTTETPRGWLRTIHDALSAEALRRDLEPRELACTLLLAVVFESSAVFAQVGDGVIIKGTGTEFHPVFWPQNGEYLNTTFFVTDPQYEDHAHFEIDSGKITELALLTDGLQMLALNYAARTAHAPFFAPLFRALRDQPVEDLTVPLRQFLESAAVNERTDDDKTLVLATRVSVESNTPI
jgi:hypothetical protein